MIDSKSNPPMTLEGIIDYIEGKNVYLVDDKISVPKGLPQHVKDAIVAHRDALIAHLSPDKVQPPEPTQAPDTEQPRESVPTDDGHKERVQKALQKWYEKSKSDAHARWCARKGIKPPPFYGKPYVEVLADNLREKGIVDAEIVRVQALYEKSAVKGLQAWGKLMRTAGMMKRS